MGLKTFTVDFKDLNQKDSIRLWIPFVLPESKYKYEKINNILDVCESGSRPKGGISDEDEGEAISLGGEQIGADGSLNLSKIPYVSYEFYESAKKGKVKDNDILICKDGALTGKTCFVDFSVLPSKDVMINEHVYILRVTEKGNQKFLYYFTITNLFQSQVKDLAYKKKAQPGLNLDHFKKIKIPTIPKKKQDAIVVQTEPIEKKIKELRSRIKQPQEVINKVFAREFGFDFEAVNKVEQIKYFQIDNDITYKNLNLRSSVRWNKITPIQKVLYRNNPFIQKLGRNIISTKNGWSANCRESDTEYYVFGVNSISKNSLINYEDLKTSDDRKGNIEEYFAKEGDLFISRGNTVDLVALASVATNLPKDKNIIFPDLFIRLEVNEEEINKMYLAHLFNSVIGRYYFKYSAKGKNQTMVKISSDELYNFYLPIPPLKMQHKIVDGIKTELDKQELIKKKMEVERNKIDEIIEKAIK
jgi:type I restriction enzyme S subunit